MKQIAAFLMHYRLLRRRLGPFVSVGLAWNLTAAAVPPGWLP